jgi:hypothetical protein
VAGGERARVVGRLGRWRLLGWVAADGARARGKDEGLPADFNEMGRDAKQGWDRGDCGLQCWAGKGGWLLLLFFSISFLKQANKFEFKPGFESKHPKTMHRHECNTHNYLFNLEIQTKDFSYTIFPVKKNKSWAKF